MKNNQYLTGWGITVCLLLSSFSLFSQFTYECPPDLHQSEIENIIQTFDFPALSSDNIMDVNDVVCLIDTPDDLYYKTYTFTVSQAGLYVFEISGLSANGLVAIYQNEPAVGVYCEDILAKGIPLASEFGYTGFDATTPTSRVAPDLRLDQSYTLLVADNVAGNVTQVGAYPLESGHINGFLDASGILIND